MVNTAREAETRENKQNGECRCKERRLLERLERRVAELEEQMRLADSDVFKCPCHELDEDEEHRKGRGEADNDDDDNNNNNNDDDDGRGSSVDMQHQQDMFLMEGAAEGDGEGPPGQEETDVEIQAALEKAAQEEEAKQEALRVLQQVQLLLQSYPVTEIVEKLEKIADLEDLGHNLQRLIEQVSKNATFGDKEMKWLERRTEEILDDRLQEVSEHVEGMRRTQEALEYLEDLLASKADCSDVANFVTGEIFDAACDDLTKGIDDCCEAINKQETEWQKSFVEIKMLLDEKLDKCEMKALKEFLHTKLTQLAKRLQKLEKIQDDIKCAATRPKVIRDLRCIVCDATVVMATEEVNTSCLSPKVASSRKLIKTDESPSEPCPAKLKPVLKKPRKSKDVILDSIEIASLEGIEIETEELFSSQITHQLTHICKRYCGGAHTITTAHERLVRRGNFYTDFNLDISAMQKKSAPKKLSKTNSNSSRLSIQN